ncbi:hypothetical protein NQZ79_g194 [Umbelopsis isabellina]|nr:hypothetical protein NQZ79_g194 [Umbelopsis isabellina]
MSFTAMDEPKPPKPPDRRESLAISAILNEESIEPRSPPDTEMDLDPRWKRRTWPSFQTAFPPISDSPHRQDDPMQMVPAPSGLPPFLTTSQQSKSNSNQILVPEEATVRHLPDGIVVCGITKGKRKRISPDQLRALVQVFKETDTPSSEVREKLAEQLDMSKREVQVWFQNRRAKASRMKGPIRDNSTDRINKHRRKSSANSSFGIPNTFVPPPFPANPALIDHHRPRRYSAVPVLQTVARPYTNIQSLKPMTQLPPANQSPMPYSGQPNSENTGSSLHPIAPKPLSSLPFNGLPLGQTSIPSGHSYLPSGMGKLRISEPQ